MGLIFLDGADHLSGEQFISKYILYEQWSSGQSLVEYYPSAGRFGGGTFALAQFFANPLQLGRQFSQFSAVMAGFYHYRRTSNAVSNSPILHFRENGTTQVALIPVDTRGASTASAQNFRLYGTSSTDVCGLSLLASFGSWEYSVWDLIEIAVSHGTGATGSIQVYISGELAVSFMGDLEVGGGSGINEVTLGTQNSVNAGNYYDDLYILNESGAPSALIGSAMRIYTVHPVSEGTTQQFTPGSGTDHYTEIDDLLTHDFSNTYLSAPSSPGQEEYIKFSSPGFGGDVKSVQFTAIAQLTSGNPLLNFQYDLSGATTSGTTSALSASWEAIAGIFDSGPGGSAWHTSYLSQIEVGFKVA